MSEDTLDSKDRPAQGTANFSYTYSAQQRREVERIRAKYIPPEENKLEQLRRLDRQAEHRGRAAALGVGIAGTLLLGIGMTLTMVFTRFFALGVIIGVLGLAGIAASYPLYQRITRKTREKIAPEILRLSEELMNGNP